MIACSVQGCWCSDEQYCGRVLGFVLWRGGKDGRVVCVLSGNDGC